jgi:hypothetical protein
MMLNFFGFCLFCKNYVTYVYLSEEEKKCALLIKLASCNKNLHLLQQNLAEILLIYTSPTPKKYSPEFFKKVKNFFHDIAKYAAVVK